MAPLICLIVSFVIFRLLGVEWGYFADSHIALRAAFGVMFLLTASGTLGTTENICDSHGSPIDGKPRLVGHLDRSG